MDLDRHRGSAMLPSELAAKTARGGGTSIEVLLGKQDLLQKLLPIFRDERPAEDSQSCLAAASMLTPSGRKRRNLKDDRDSRTEANPAFLPRVALMSFDVLHSLVGLSFLALWAFIGQIVLAERL